MGDDILPTPHAIYWLKSRWLLLLLVVGCLLLTQASPLYAYDDKELQEITDLLQRFFTLSSGSLDRLELAPELSALFTSAYLQHPTLLTQVDKLQATLAFHRAAGTAWPLAAGGNPTPSWSYCSLDVVAPKATAFVLEHSQDILYRFLLLREGEVWRISAVESSDAPGSPLLDAVAKVYQTRGLSKAEYFSLAAAVGELRGKTETWLDSCQNLLRQFPELIVLREGWELIWAKGALSPIANEFDFALSWQGLDKGFSLSSEPYPLMPRRLAGEIYVPLRRVMEQAGALVSWDEETNHTDVRYGLNHLTYDYNGFILQFNSGSIAVDQPIPLMGSRAYLPVELMAKLLDRELYQDGQGCLILANREMNPAAVRELLSQLSKLFASYDELEQRLRPHFWSEEVPSISELARAILALEVPRQLTNEPSSGVASSGTAELSPPLPAQEIEWDLISPKFSSLLRRRLDVPTSYTEITVTPLLDWDSHQTFGYSFTWSEPFPLHNYGYYEYASSISLRTDSLGKTTYFSAGYNDRNWPQGILPWWDRQLIIASTYSFLCRLYPEYALDLGAQAVSEYPLEPSGTNSFYFPRMSQGIRVMDQGISTYLDPQGRAMGAYAYWWDDLTAPTLKPPLLTSGELRQAMGDLYSLELVYARSPFFNPPSRYIHNWEFGEPALYYQSVFNGFRRSYPVGQDELWQAGAESFVATNKHSNFFVVVEREFSDFLPPGDVQPPEGEFILASLKANPWLFVPEELQMLRGPYNTVFYREASGEVSMRFEGSLLTEYPHDGAYLYGIWDIASGKLREFFYSHYPGAATYERGEITFQPLSWEKLRQQGAAFLQDQWPELYRQTRLLPYPSTNLPDTIYDSPLATATVCLTWQRLVEGIPYIDNYLSVWLDTRSGLVTNLEVVWEADRTFPAASLALTKAQAENIFWDAFPPQATYRINYTTQELELFYESEYYDLAMLDTASRRIHTLDGALYLPEGALVYPALGDHPASNLLELAYRWGYLPAAATEFSTTKPMRQDDLVFGVARLHKYNHMVTSKAAAYEHLRSLGIFTDPEANPGGSVSGATALSWLLHVLEYDALLDQESLFEPLPGVPAELLSLVAMGRGLGLCDATFDFLAPLSEYQGALLIARALALFPG